MTTPTPTKDYFNNHVSQLIRNLENAGGQIDNGLSILRHRADRLNDDNFVIIPFITDTHANNDSLDNKPASNKDTEIEGTSAKQDAERSFEHINNLRNFAERFDVDAIVHGGDFIDGKSTRAQSALDLKTIIEGVQTLGAPALFAKGNHDDNWLYTSKMVDKDTNVSNYKSISHMLKPNVFDPILRGERYGSKGSNGVVFDKPYENAKSEFTTAFEPFMESEEYAVVKKAILGNDTGSKRLGAENMETLRNMYKSVEKTTATEAEKLAWDNFNKLTAPPEIAALKSTTDQTNMKKLIYKISVARSTGSYGYYDVKGVRLIVLNCYDMPYRTTKVTYRDEKLNAVKNDTPVYPIGDYGGYGKRQVEWFANVALKTKNPVLIFSHIPLTGSPFTKDGGSYALKGSGDEYWIGNIEIMKAILDDFINGKSVKHGSVSATTRYNNYSLSNDDPTKTPNYFYKNNAKKKAITDELAVDADFTTDFASQGAGTVIGCISGHSHVAKMGAELIGGKYVHAMSNCSLRERSDNSSVPRPYMTYKEDAWEVLVIDKAKKTVYMYPMGAEMINATELPTDAKTQDDILNNPNALPKEITGKNEKGEDEKVRTFPYRKFGYGSEYYGTELDKDGKIVSKFDKTLVNGLEDLI